MADRYQNRPYAANEAYDRDDDPRAPETDPLAELARLIGQTDPFAGIGRANLPVQPRSAARDRYEASDRYEPPIEDEAPVPGPPSWMQHAVRHEAPPPSEDDYHDDYVEDQPRPVHPLQRYAAAHPEPAPDYHQPQLFAHDYQAHDPQAHDPQTHDPSRYDDALYGQLETGQPPLDPAYADDHYDYQDGYDESAEDRTHKRRGGMVTVVAVLALAVVGTGAAFAYRTYVGSPRSGEPPIIRADAGPTKVVPAAASASPKVLDRMAAGDGAEKIVPREEAPVDVNAGPRVVFPPLNQIGVPPAPVNVAPSVPPATGSNGTMPNNEPRKIRTFAVRGDQPDGSAAPAGSAPAAAAKPAPARVTATMAQPAPKANAAAPANANASSANAPLSLAPQGGAQAAPAPAATEPRTRVAATSPIQVGAQAAPGGGNSSGGYLVQVSSQRNETDAQASYKALQGKFPAVLGSHSPLIKRADLGEKGVYYRAMVGPFGTPDEASQFCGNLKSAGGQCVVQKN